MARQEQRFECTCSKRLYSRTERERGTCATCFVASWSPAKLKAMQHLVGVAFRKSCGEDVSDEKLGNAIEQAKAHLDEPITPPRRATGE